MTKNLLRARMLLVLVIASGLLGAHLVAYARSGVVAYPAGGQSAEQQAKDEYECQQWAQRETGVDPRQPPPRAYTDGYAPSYSSSGGEVIRGAAGGAMIGAIAGDAGKGAAAGAMFGAIRRSNRRQQEQQWQAQQQAQLRQQQQMLNQQHQQAQQGYAQAIRLCMSSRNYNVH